MKFLKKIRHILEYVIVLIVFRLLLLIGFERACNFCSIIARTIGPYLKVSKIARKNIKETIGDQNLEEIIDGLWDNYGRYIAEFVYLEKLTKQDTGDRVEFVGMENIAPYIQANQPYILCLAHLANWDFLIKHTDTLYHKFAIIYRKVNNPYIDKMILSTRENENLIMIPKGPSGVKKLIKAIKSGRSIAMLVDQKMNDGIAVPFLGKKAMTAHAIAKLSLQYNYPIVPLQIIRTKDNKFKGIIHPRINVELTEDSDKNIYNIMLEINDLIGKWVRQNPKQWFWFHNRWGKFKE